MPTLWCRSRMSTEAPEDSGMQAPTVTQISTRQRDLALSVLTVAFAEGMGLIHGYLRAMEHCTASREKLKAMCQWLARCCHRTAEHA